MSNSGTRFEWTWKFAFTLNWPRKCDYYVRNRSRNFCGTPFRWTAPNSAIQIAKSNALFKWLRLYGGGVWGVSNNSRRGKIWSVQPRPGQNSACSRMLLLWTGVKRRNIIEDKTLVTIGAELISPWLIQPLHVSLTKMGTMGTILVPNITEQWGKCFCLGLSNQSE